MVFRRKDYLKHTLLSLHLIYSDSDRYFKNKDDKSENLGNMRTFLGSNKKLVLLRKTSDIRVRTNKTPLSPKEIGIHNAFQEN